MRRRYVANDSDAIRRLEHEPGLMWPTKDFINPPASVDAALIKKIDISPILGHGFDRFPLAHFPSLRLGWLVRHQGEKFRAFDQQVKQRLGGAVEFALAGCPSADCATINAGDAGEPGVCDAEFLHLITVTLR